jgi:hypothetical protein
MKKQQLLLPFFFLMLIGCKTQNTTKPVEYAFMHFERDGGGQLDFRVYPGMDRSTVRIIIARYNYQEAKEEFELKINGQNANAFNAFYRTLNGQTTIKGDYKHSKGLTGTWSHFYFVYGDHETEVLNPDLRTTLSAFETSIREKEHLK